jgi:hypothetical protein
MPSTDLVVYDSSATLREELDELRAENQRLSTALRQANAQVERAKAEATRALVPLRKQLTPLFRALQGVFGELDAFGVGEETARGTGVEGTDGRLDAIWSGWKQRLGPTCAKVIDALRLQSDMTNRQLAVAIGTGRLQTVYDAISKMNKVSLLTKNGDRYSLKAL